MFYDLNVPFTTATDPNLPTTLAFLKELGYSVIALTYTLSGKLPLTHTCPIPTPLPFAVPLNLTILRRLTIELSSPIPRSQLKALSSSYDLVALRTSDEKTLQVCCDTLQCDLISFDLSRRLGFPFRFKTFSEASNRGLRLEICYAQGVAGDAQARRNVIANVTCLVRATRGRDLIVSSGAGRAVECRAPWDVINLVGVWGLGRDRAFEAVSDDAGRVTRMAELRRRGWRGVLEVVANGEKVEQKTKPDQVKGEEVETLPKSRGQTTKRKADGGSEPLEKLSKTQIKKRAKRARDEEQKKTAS